MSVTQAQFMVELARVESDFRYGAQNATSKAMGRYQILAANWRAWAPRALDWEGEPVATKELDPADWQPPTTAYNQERVAIWEVARIYRVQGDWRRVAASWRSGRSVGRQQPAEWTSGTLKYTTSVTQPLGFPETTRETELPPLPGGPVEPEQPDLHAVLIEKVDQLLARADEVDEARAEVERVHHWVDEFVARLTAAMDELTGRIA